jgi:hypothetical protein
LKDSEIARTGEGIKTRVLNYTPTFYKYKYEKLSGYGYPTIITKVDTYKSPVNHYSGKFGIFPVETNKNNTIYVYWTGHANIGTQIYKLDEIENGNNSILVYDTVNKINITNDKTKVWGINEISGLKKIYANPILSDMVIVYNSGELNSLAFYQTDGNNDDWYKDTKPKNIKYYMNNLEQDYIDKHSNYKLYFVLKNGIINDIIYDYDGYDINSDFRIKDSILSKDYLNVQLVNDTSPDGIWFPGFDWEY